MKELKKIRTDKIDKSDKRFIFSEEQICSPHELPVYYQEKNTYIPLKEYEDKEGMIDAFVYSSDMSYSEILKELISDMDLNVFDQARIMEKLEKYEADTDKKEWSNLFRINLKKWNDVKTLAEYDHIWQSYFIDKKTPIKRILHFDSLGLRQSMLALLELNPGINILESIAALLIETAHREKCDVKQMWLELSIQDILDDDEIENSNKLKMIKDSLYSKRYPTIAKYRKEMDKHLGAIPRTAGVDLRSDENFETPGMQLSAKLRSKQDIEDLQNWLEKQKNELGKIIDIQKGNEK